jgi:hypothetical protein
VAILRRTAGHRGVVTSRRNQPSKAEGEVALNQKGPSLGDGAGAVVLKASAGSAVAREQASKGLTGVCFLDAEATDFAGIGSWLESYIFRLYLWVAAARWAAPIDSFELFRYPPDT